MTIARKRRIWNPDMFDHVVVRGNNRQNIFFNKGDIEALFRVLNYTYSKHPFTIIAYCIMNNHFHLLIRSPHAPLSKVMGIINRRYSDYYRKKYDYTGYLYESRYFSKMVFGHSGLLAVSNYIHRNPIATMTPIVDRMEQYQYSSFRLYHTNSQPPYPFINLELLPSILPPTYDNSVQGYCKYCEEFALDENIDIYKTVESPNR